MAKGGISKSKRGPSIHSRAARRETSPSIDTDKSLKFVHTPQDDSSADRRPTVLAAHHSGGVTKPAKRKQAMSSKARKRHEKSMDRAEAIMDRTAKKVEKSKGQAKVIYSRRKTWEEVNTEALEAVVAVGGVAAVPAKPAKKALSKERWEEDEYVRRFYAEDGDAEMEEVDESVVEGEVQQQQPSAMGAVEVPAQTSVPPAPPPDDEDEIL